MNPAAFLPYLLRQSAAAGVLVLIVLFAQWLFRRQLSPRWRCALWLLLIARLALPWSPASPVSVFNLLPVFPTPISPASPSLPATAREIKAIAPAAEAPITAADRAASPGSAVASRAVPVGPDPTLVLPREEAIQAPPSVPGSAPAASPAPVSITSARSLPWPAIAVAIWLAGVLGLTVLLAVSTLQLNRRLRRSRPLQDAAAERMLDKCRQELGIKVRPVLIETAAVLSPALFGVFHPRLLLPEGFTEHFSPAQLRLVFCHELAHLRRRDLLLNWLVAGLQVIHWFNPLVWIGFARWRADRELACDAIVLEAVGADQSREYGATVLRLLETFIRRAPLPGLVGILEDKTRLRRRLEMIARFQPSARWPVGSMALLAALAGLCLTDARSVVPSVAPLPSLRPISGAPRSLPSPAPELASTLSPTPDVPPARAVSESPSETLAAVEAIAPVSIPERAAPSEAVVSSAVMGNSAPEAPKPAALEPDAAPQSISATPARPESAAIREEAKIQESPHLTPPLPAAPALTFFVVGDSLAADPREPDDGWGSVQPASDKLPTIFMIGDETVRGGRGIGAGNQWGWGDLVAGYLNEAKVNLMVIGGYGLSSRSFLTSGRWRALRHWVQRRDIVLIEFGHYESTPVDDPTGRGTLSGLGRETVATAQFPRGRDFDDRNVHHGRETVYTYGGYLRTYLAEAKKDGAQPILISPTPRNHWKDGKIIRDSKLVRETTQVAKEAGVPFFDLNSMLADQYDAMGQPAAERCFTDPAFATSYAGARLAAEAVVKLLLVQNPTRIQNFLNSSLAVTFRGKTLKPTTASQSESFWQVMADYRAIDKGMSKTEVVTRLGSPDRSNRNQSIYWRQGPFSLNRTPYIELDVVYDPTDRVVETRFLQGTDRDTLPSPLP